MAGRYSLRVGPGKSMYCLLLAAQWVHHNQKSTRRACSVKSSCRQQINSSLSKSVIAKLKSLEKSTRKGFNIPEFLYFSVYFSCRRVLWCKQTILMNSWLNLAILGFSF